MSLCVVWPTILPQWWVSLTRLCAAYLILLLSDWYWNGSLVCPTCHRKSHGGQNFTTQTTQTPHSSFLPFFVRSCFYAGWTRLWGRTCPGCQNMWWLKNHTNSGFMFYRGSRLQWHPRERPKSVTVSKWHLLCHCNHLNFPIYWEFGTSEKCHCNQIALYSVTVTGVTVTRLLFTLSL